MARTLFGPFLFSLPSTPLRRPCKKISAYVLRMAFIILHASQLSLTMESDEQMAIGINTIPAMMRQMDSLIFFISISYMIYCGWATDVQCRCKERNGCLCILTELPCFVNCLVLTQHLCNICDGVINLKPKCMRLLL